MITKMEQIVKEDMAEYILEELSKYDCVPDEKEGNGYECNYKIFAGYPKV